MRRKQMFARLMTDRGPPFWNFWDPSVWAPSSSLSNGSRTPGLGEAWWWCNNNKYPFLFFVWSWKPARSSVLHFFFPRVTCHDYIFFDYYFINIYTTPVVTGLVITTDTFVPTNIVSSSWENSFFHFYYCWTIASRKNSRWYFFLLLFTVLLHLSSGATGVLCWFLCGQSFWRGLAQSMNLLLFVWNGQQLLAVYTAEPSCQVCTPSSSSVWMV